MDEDRESHVRISEQTHYLGLSSSSSSSGTHVGEEVHDSIKTVDSDYTFKQEVDSEPAKKIVRKSILKYSGSHKPELRSSVLEEYKRASSVKELKRQTKEDRQSIKARQSLVSEKQPDRERWQHSQIKLQDDIASIKCLGIKQVGIQLLSSISMLANEHRCPPEPFGNMEMPHNFFSWNLDDCMARFEMSMVWYNLLQKQISPQCLETRKISADFSELKRLINVILEGYLEKHINMYEVLMILNLTDDYIHLEDTLTKELNRNSDTYTTQLYRKIAFTFIRRVSEVQRGTSEDDTADDGINCPIVVRYLTKYQESVEEQHKLLCEMKEQDLEDKNAKAIKRRESEEYCSQSTMNYYYNENASLRQKLRDLTKKYDRDYEREQSKNTYLELSTKNLVTQREYLMEQISRFHEDVIEMKAAKIAEEEAELEKLRAAVEAEEQRLYEKKMAKRKKRLELQRQRRIIMDQNIKKLQKKSQDET